MQAAHLFSITIFKPANGSFGLLQAPGHGGFDPGKIAVDGSLEKDINLEIAQRVKRYLEASDVEVVMTRDSDTALCGESDSNKKSADMRNRCQLINDASPDLTISIHQNSYHEEYVKGAPPKPTTATTCCSTSKAPSSSWSADS